MHGEKMLGLARALSWSLGAFICAMALPLAAQEMASRVQSGDLGEAMTRRATLRSISAPVMEVRIAPTGKQLLDAAESSSRSENLSPLAKALGIKPPPRPSAPRRVGSVFPANADSRIVQWETLTDGSHVTHIRISSGGALGIRAKLQLPSGMTIGELRAVARQDDVAETVPLWVANQGENQGERQSEIWTPYTDGDTQLVEIQTPQRVEGSQIRVVSIAHFEESLNESKGPGLSSVSTAAGACSPDVVCTSNSSSIDAGIAERSKSVVRLSFMSDGGSYLCSGTLINSNAQQNFLLTANHCISTQAEAASLSMRWFYEASTCGGGAASVTGAVTISGGAQLMFTNQFVDQTLLRMNLAPPGGAIFSGWNAAAAAPNTSIVSISHPTGDVMKFAVGTISSTIQDRTDGLIRLSDYEQEMYAILFSRGIIEGGSSGSGLFTLSGSSLQLRGVLSSSTVVNSANGLSCSNTTENANYGRFDYFYPQIAPLLNGQSIPADDYPNQPLSTGPALTPGATLTGSLSYVGDIDVFRIPVTQSGTLFVKSAGGFDLIGNLMDANGTTLKTNDDDFGNNNEFGIAWQVNPGTYYLAVAPYDPSVLANNYSVSASFTTATTNHTALWWGGASEDGWGVNVNQQGNTIFATMFNYEATGAQLNPNMWLVSTGTRIGSADSFSGDLYRVVGPGFNASPFTPISAANSTRVGSMRFDFTGIDAGTLTYTVSGAGTGGTGSTVTKNISRQTFGTQPICELSGGDRTYTFNYQDLWWNPNESGWGVNFTHQSDTIFATLFTYEPGAGNANKGLWLVATMPKSSGSQTFQGDLLKVMGPAFDFVPPSLPSLRVSSNIRVGNMRVQFTNGNSAQLTYDVNGQQVTKTIERQVFDTFRPECEKP